MFLVMYRFSRPRCNHRASSCPTRRPAVKFPAWCCICLSSVNSSAFHPLTSFSPRSGRTYLENSTRKKTRGLAFASGCRTVSSIKIIRPKCLKDQRINSHTDITPKSLVRRTLGVVALLDLLTLASSCSTSSSTHAPPSAFSRVLYDSNGNFKLGSHTQDSHPTPHTNRIPTTII